MAATVTLSTTTLVDGCTPSAQQIKVASTSGLTAGTRLFVDRELMKVVSLDIDPWVNVLRGVDGTSASAHSSGGTLYIGRGDQFYQSDPVGSPSVVIPVSPYINVVTGGVWFARGDAKDRSIRWWQQQSTTFGVGSLGVRTTTLEPTVST